MNGRRALVSATVAAVAAAALGLLTAGPAAAHGTQSTPLSRSLACRVDGTVAVQPAVCQAAIATSGTTQFSAFDNLRVPNVNGMDRQLIPNGKLCSGGLATYAGLDLPRTDWPSTPLTPGAAFTFKYVTTIPHAGTFKLFLTKEGFDPTKALTWDNVDATPFLTVTDPPIVNGAYEMTGTVPTGRTGRHILYTIWQNVQVDTYYSCSDVTFGGQTTTAAAAGQAATGVTGQAAAPAAQPVTAVGGQGAGATGLTGAAPVAGQGAVAAAPAAGQPAGQVAGQVAGQAAAQAAGQVAAQPATGTVVAGGPAVPAAAGNAVPAAVGAQPASGAATGTVLTTRPVAATTGLGALPWGPALLLLGGGLALLGAGRALRSRSRPRPR